MTTLAAVASRVYPGEESLQVIARTVQWRVDVSTFTQPSKKFQLGNWTWHLSLMVIRSSYSYGTSCRLCLSATNDLDKKLHADFVLRFAYDNMPWQSWLTRTVNKQCFQSGGDPPFMHEFEVFCNRLVIEIEFLNMEIDRSNGKQLIPESPASGALRVSSEATQEPLKCLSRMFTESIHTDLIINTKNGKLNAHTAVLAASSPVFALMFDNDFKEKVSSTIDIKGMSLESCNAFLSYLYGDLREEDLWKHRVALLEAAHRYGVVKLQKMCEDCLLEDINLSNVIERLLQAHLYKLKNLKQSCVKYLFELEKVAAISDEFSSFVLETDPVLAKELLKIMLSK